MTDDTFGTALPGWSPNAPTVVQPVMSSTTPVSISVSQSADVSTATVVANTSTAQYSVILPSSPIDYTPADPIVANVYKLIASGNAFNTASQTNAALIKQISSDLLYILLYLNGVNDTVKFLAVAADQASSLKDHVDYHYENLIDNLQLVSSGISDAIGYGVIGTAGCPAGSINDPTASYSDFFGSITGKSDTFIAQATSQLVGMMAHACALIAGAIISTYQSCPDARVQAALGTLTTQTALVDAMAVLTQSNLNLMQQAISNVGAVMASGDQSLLSYGEVYAVAAALGIVPIVIGTTSSNTSGDGG